MKPSCKTCERWEASRIAWTAERLPAGLQLIGAPSSDARTLACAEWLLERLGREAPAHQ